MAFAGQLEKHIPAAAKAGIGLWHLGASEAAPFQNRFKGLKPDPFKTDSS
jgi:hypothetical protein